MIRSLIFIAGGIVLGLIIHLVVMLSLPSFAEEDNWSRILKFNALERVQVLSTPQSFEPNPLRLDPNMLVAICRLNLTNGPGVVTGVLPNSFWSVSVFDRSDHAVYGTTNRSGLGRSLQLGIFNAGQTRLLAQRELEITEGLLIVESDMDDIYVVVRSLVPLKEMAPRFRAQLSTLTCTNAAMRPPEDLEPEPVRDPSIPYPADRPTNR